MEQILDKNGKVIRTSQNLRGILTYVSELRREWDCFTPRFGGNPIKVLSIDAIADGKGKLMILFKGGVNYETNFASFAVLKEFVRTRLHFQGARLLVNGTASGVVARNNPALKK